MNADPAVVRSEDESHLDLLAVFHYVVGGLTALFACLFLFHVGLGIAMLSGALDGGKDGPVPAFVGLMFLVFPGLVMLGGWTLGALMIAAGRRLKRRASHRFCLVVAGAACIVMPLGTVLGVFTILVLMRDSVKRLFAANEAAAGPV